MGTPCAATDVQGCVQPCCELLHLPGHLLLRIAVEVADPSDLSSLLTTYSSFGRMARDSELQVWGGPRRGVGPMPPQTCTQLAVVACTASSS